MILTTSSPLIKHVALGSYLKPHVRLLVTMVALMAMILGQWCQTSMSLKKVDLASASILSSGNSALQSLNEFAASDTSHQHRCCPEETSVGQQPLDCEDGQGVFSPDHRSVSLEYPDTTLSFLSVNVGLMVADALTLYWRYRETLWSGLSRPIYLLISLFLE